MELSRQHAVCSAASAWAGVSADGLANDSASRIVMPSGSVSIRPPKVAFAARCPNLCHMLGFAVVLRRSPAQAAKFGFDTWLGL
jgi:hypothetical protein